MKVTNTLTSWAHSAEQWLLFNVLKVLGSLNGLARVDYLETQKNTTCRGLQLLAAWRGPFKPNQSFLPQTKFTPKYFNLPKKNPQNVLFQGQLRVL